MSGGEGWGVCVSVCECGVCGCEAKEVWVYVCWDVGCRGMGYMCVRVWDICVLGCVGVLCQDVWCVGVRSMCQGVGNVGCGGVEMRGVGVSGVGGGKMLLCSVLSLQSERKKPENNVVLSFQSDF